jgi:peptide chain release factor subunit 1
MSGIDDFQRYKLRKFVKELEKYRGRHTEMVTVFVPAGYDINAIVNHLMQEQGTAENIKSSGTKKNVIDALERMIQHLRLFKRTPPNGLAAFSGNVAEREGQSDVRVWSMEPPVPLNFRTYRCDKEFQLKPLQDMLDIKETYALVVFDRRDAILALLRGKTIIPLVKTHSEVPGKFKAGGQSAQRFARNRELSAMDHFKKIADYMKQEFLNRPEIKGIILGGPGTTVNDFMGHDYVTGDVKKKIIGTKDLSYTEEFGLQELLEKSQDLLAHEDVAREKEAMQKFFNLLAKKPGTVTYGLAEVLKHLNMGIVETVLVSEDLDDDNISKIEELSTKYGTKMQLVSTETREGVQLREMGKVVAILRYDTGYNN